MDSRSGMLENEHRREHGLVGTILVTPRLKKTRYWGVGVEDYDIKPGLRVRNPETVQARLAFGASGK